MASGFSLTAWLIVACYLLAVSTIGSSFYRRRSSAPEFFLGGRRMSAIPVAISLVAADMSAISYMGIPAWTFRNNLELFFSSATILLAAPVVMYLFLPFYSRLKLYTAYEYLERRFDLKTRLLGSMLFLLTRGSHVAIAIYAPSIILSLITGLPVAVCVLIMGVSTTVYTTLGGMKAVIWTDVMQFTVLFSGLVTVGWLSVSRVPGGLMGVLHTSAAAGRFHLFNFSTDPTQLTTIWATVIGGGFMVLSTLGTDQAYLQRYFTTRNLREGRLSILMDAIIVVPVSLLLYLVGPVLFSFYHFYPKRLQGLPVYDAILPFFVIHELGGALSGLVIASIFAASMAVMSAGINSLTTATTVDLYQRLLRPGSTDAERVRAGRFGTVAWGAVCTIGALFAGRLGPIVNAFNMINSFLGGPILGIFLLGMLTRRTNGTAAVMAGATGLTVVLAFAWATKISFFYYALIGVTVTFTCGWMLGRLLRAPKEAEISGLVRGLP